MRIKFKWCISNWKKATMYSYFCSGRSIQKIFPRDADWVRIQITMAAGTIHNLITFQRCFVIVMDGVLLLSSEHWPIRGQYPAPLDQSEARAVLLLSDLLDSAISGGSSVIQVSSDGDWELFNLIWGHYPVMWHVIIMSIRACQGPMIQIGRWCLCWPWQYLKGGMIWASASSI